MNQTLTHRNWVVTPTCNTKKSRLGDLANSEHKNINKIVPIVGGVTIGGQESFSMIYMFKKMLASLNSTKNIHLKLLVWSSRKKPSKLATKKTNAKLLPRFFRDLPSHHLLPWSRLSRFVGDGRPPTFNRNPYSGYINPYYWVDDHPYYIYGNNGSLDPGTFQKW